MTSTTYILTKETVSASSTHLILQVSVVNTVISTEEVHRDTFKSKVVIEVGVNYTESDVIDALVAQGFNL